MILTFKKIITMKILGIDSRVTDIIKGLGIETKNLKELHIHFVPDDMVYADAIYIIKSIIDSDKIKEVFKKYRLEEIEVNEKKKIIKKN